RGLASQHGCHRRAQRLVFALKPGLPCCHLPTVRLLVNPLLAPRLAPVEMFDRISHVRLPPADPRFLKGAVKDLPRRSDERLPFNVLSVARLLADKHYARGLLALANYCLRSAR